LEDGREIDIHQELILNKMAEAVRDHFRIKKEEKKIKQDEIKMYDINQAEEKDKWENYQEKQNTKGEKSNTGGGA